VRFVVLVLAGFFDGISDNWLHGLVLWSAACVVGWEAVQESVGAASPERPLLPRSDAGRRSRITGGVLVVIALAFAVTVGSWHRYTWPMTGAIVLVGIAGLAAGWRGPLTTPTAVRAPDRVGSRLWVGLGVTAGLWELLALSQQPSLTEGSDAHPTVSVLMDSVLASHAGRSLALLAWLALGWFLLEATTVGPRPGSPRRATEASDELA
jgi:drug/metabolite transporter superfamily protein YnfA